MHQSDPLTTTLLLVGGLAMAFLASYGAWRLIRESTLSLADAANIVQIVGIIGIFSALMYSNLQLRATERSIEASAYLEFESSALQVTKLFAQYPHLRPYFYENKKIPKSPSVKLKGEIDSVTEFMADFFDHTMTIQRLVKSSSWSKPLWKAWMDEVVESSPCLKKFLSKRGGWYVKNCCSLFVGNGNSSPSVHSCFPMKHRKL
jgi:hypothetical protein